MDLFLADDCTFVEIVFYYLALPDSESMKKATESGRHSLSLLVLVAPVGA